MRGIPIDEEGLIPEALDEICREERPRLLYCMPTLQNPTCAQLPMARREVIAEIAERQDLMIVQDEIQTGLIEDQPASLAEFLPDRVLTIASLSKTLSPGLRIAYLAGPSALTARLGETIWSSVWMTSPMGALLANLACHTRPGSYHVWLELPDRWESRGFAAALLDEGIRVSPSNEFAVDGRPTRQAIRISLSATPTREALSRGLKAIRRLHDGAPGPVTLL